MSFIGPRKNGGAHPVRSVRQIEHETLHQFFQFRSNQIRFRTRCAPSAKKVRQKRYKKLYIYKTLYFYSLDYCHRSDILITVGSQQQV